MASTTSPVLHPLGAENLVAFHDSGGGARDVVLVGSSRPGCSAVSPPSSAQPASAHASAMPLTIAAIRSGITLPQAM